MKDKIIDLLHRKLKLSKEEVENLLEVPPNPKMGDYAFPCFTLSKKLKKNPVEISLELTRDLSKTLPANIESIEAKGPYVNFSINKNKLVKEILTHATKKDYGRGKEKEKILVEHTSINPNASPHVGRARNSIIGDSIVRILKFMGNKVEVHYYVNDVSKQIAILALNFKAKDKFEDMLERYVEISKKIEKDENLEKQVFESLKKFEAGDKKTKELFNKIVRTCIEGQEKIFTKFGIKFDKFDYESKYIGKPSEKILHELEKTGKLFTDKDGRMVLDQSNTDLIRKMKSPVFVLARSNGTGLYGLRDISYTIEKSKHNKNIIILGEDQKLYFEQIAEAVKLLGYKIPEVVHYSFVLIQEDKKIKKMSTRRGELVLLEDFYKEAIKKAEAGIKKRGTKGDPKKVAVGAIKYSMLKNDNDKNIIFSWDTSLNFEGDTGPYLQYSYARASTIVKKSKVKPSMKLPKELTDSEIKLVKKIGEFPEVVSRASKRLNPSGIANYSFQLAQTFNEFYHSSKVIGDENEAFRLNIIEAFRNTIKNSLDLLGIEVMEEM